MNKKYVIKYKIIFDNDEVLDNKEIKVSNCFNGVGAQVKLEDYLKRKYVNFKQLIVYECKEESDINDLLGQFGDIFGEMGFGKNMFGGK